eukprot:TRINITY_DN1789_c0_g1_i1.p1 TRINITY_DN1789_c0_g1~~TRINITY_DN1789_c0_g1_i1.p1  ORF type:complete len:880 (+),score=318.49 TRINITY_DN1789_c0_g1_i1:276-2642(+)
MVYLVLKELSTMSEDVIIVMASLTKDMNCKTDLYRANAIRVLTGITDNTMLAQIERYLKQAIVDKEPYVSSAALVSGTHLMGTSPEIVKRWVTEVQESLQSSSMMVQYHALGLLHQIKQNDRLAVSKLVTSMTKGSIRSPYAHCLLIRFTSQCMEEDPTSGDRGFFAYLETCLRHKSDMVIYEAARAICNLRNVTSRELTPAVTVLQLFLSSPKASLRFAAVRTLNKVAQTHPLSVTTCNLDLENLITDSNRSIATLAITTLLKTGSESSVDRLMKQISNFMNEISDEFKIVVVGAIRSLCLKYPAKFRTLLTFLSNILRDEGGFEYKKSIVETILTVINDIPDSKEAGLTHLCEFIEDCEFTYLSTKILHLLGKEGPNALFPSRYIRYIHNRISLENASVRASAVSALAKFGVKLESLRPNIIILLRRCLSDNDDEVRDRAAFYLRVLEEEPAGRKGILDEFYIPIPNLEKALLEYQKNPSATPFDASRVSLTPVKETPKPNSLGGPVKATAASPQAAVQPSAPPASVLLASIPQLANIGTLFASSKAIELTESETEYVVTCTKHIFPAHLVLQYNITNTLKEQLLENVTVKIDTGDIKGLSVVSVIPVPSLPYDQPSNSFVLLTRPADTLALGTLANSLKFRSKEIDPSTGEPEEGGYEDEYQLENIELTTSDYVQKTFVPNWAEKWEELGDEFEVMETYSLSSTKNLNDAVRDVSNFLGMQPCDRTEKTQPKKSKHILLLSGNFIGDVPALARCRMKLTETAGVQIELTVRSASDDASTALASAI